MSEMATLRILLILAFFGLGKADTTKSSECSVCRTFLHISDIHLDIHYQEGGDESEMCRQV